MRISRYSTGGLLHSRCVPRNVHRPHRDVRPRRTRNRGSWGYAPGHVLVLAGPSCQLGDFVIATRKGMGGGFRYSIFTHGVLRKALNSYYQRSIWDVLL